MSVLDALQNLTTAWLHACFPEEMANNKAERGARVIEEAVELAQVMGTSRELAHRLVDRVFDNPTGQADQELGGLAVVTAAAAGTLGLSVNDCHQRELGRIIGQMPAIRAKQAHKAEQGLTA